LCLTEAFSALKVPFTAARPTIQEITKPGLPPLPRAPFTQRFMRKLRTINRDFWDNAGDLLGEMFTPPPVVPEPDCFRPEHAAAAKRTAGTTRHPSATAYPATGAAARHYSNAGANRPADALVVADSPSL
jgi:hypothetical protein